MELGTFSISLAVKDIAASRAFCEKFGFRAFAGDASKHWLILKNGPHVIGLFQGMFEKNSLTVKTQYVHRRSRSAARIESTRCTASTGPASVYRN